MEYVRKLKKKDAPQVVKLIGQLTQNIVEPENFVSRLEKMSEPENYQYFVAEVDGNIVGFAGIAWYPVPSKQLRGWVEEVVVDKECRGKGLAQKLMNKLLELAKEKDIKQVMLITNNPVAKHIYEKIGFIKREDDLFEINPAPSSSYQDMIRDEGAG